MKSESRSTNRFIEIEATPFSPSVKIDKDQSKMVISGTSISIQSREFYLSVLGILNTCPEFMSRKASIIFRFHDFINSQSIQMLVYLIKRLNTIKHQGKSLHITWEYHESDKEIGETGEMLSEITGIPFTYKIHPAHRVLLDIR